MDAKFSPRVKDVISYSREEALRLGHNYIGVEHLLLGIIREGEGTAVRILESLNVDLQKLRKVVESSIRPTSGKSVGAGNIPVMKQAELVLKVTYLEAKVFKSGTIGTEHLLLSILKDEDNVATKSLIAFNIEYDVAKEEFENLLNAEGGRTDMNPRADSTGMGDDEDDMPGIGGGSGGGSGGWGNSGGGGGGSSGGWGGGGASGWNLYQIYGND